MRHVCFKRAIQTAKHVTAPTVPPILSERVPCLTMFYKDIGKARFEQTSRALEQRHCSYLGITGMSYVHM